MYGISLNSIKTTCKDTHFRSLFSIFASNIKIVYEERFYMDADDETQMRDNNTYPVPVIALTTKKKEPR